MTNERDESGGCGASIGKIFTMVGLAIISMVKFSDDLIRGCSHSSGSVDNLLQKVGRIHPPRNSTSLEVIPKVSDNTFITEIEHVPSINNFSTNEHFLKDFFTKNSRFSESEKKLLSKNLQQNSEQTIKQLIQYETDVKKLNNAFGKDDKLLIEYHNSFKTNFNHLKARQALLPENLLNLPNNSKSYQLYSLFKGIPLDRQQADLLSKLTNKVITPLPDRYKNYVLLEQKEHNIIIKTAKSMRILERGEFINNLEINRESQIILDGDFDENLIKYFSDKGVKYVRTAQSLVKNVNIETDKLNFIYVASKDKTTLKNLFQISDEQSDEMINILEKIELNPQSNLIDNESDLMQAILESKNCGNLPVIVFNNIDNKLFGRAIESFNVQDFITCKSYGLQMRSQNQMTTDFIYFEDFTASVEKVLACLPDDVEQFWQQFSVEYGNRLAKRQNNLTVTVVIGGATVAIGCYVINRSETKNE